MEHEIMDINVALASNKTEHESFKRRFEVLEKESHERTQILLQLKDQSNEIKNLAESVKSLTENIGKLEQRVKKLEQKPADTASKLVFEIIKYVVLAGVGAVIALLSKGGI